MGDDFKIKEATAGVPELIREFLRQEFTGSALLKLKVENRSAAMHLVADLLQS